MSQADNIPESAGSVPVVTRSDVVVVGGDPGDIPSANASVMETAA